MSNPDNFSIWYRIRTTLIYNLLHLGGPARLDEAQDPRLQLEREYLRRKEVHEAHREGRPVRPRRGHAPPKPRVPTRSWRAQSSASWRSSGSPSSSRSPEPAAWGLTRHLPFIFWTASRTPRRYSRPRGCQRSRPYGPAPRRFGVPMPDQPVLDLPMLGQTHGNRSAVTCHLKCDSACAFPAPNPSTETSFADIASRQLSRRRLLVECGSRHGGGLLFDLPRRAGRRCPPAARRAAVWTSSPSPRSRRRSMRSPCLRATAGTPIIRWGDPLFWNSPAFDPEVPDAEAQELQFGYNNDYLDILVTDRRGRRALLCCNHEYTNRNIMFPPTANAAQEREVIKTTMAAHGFSVVELQRRGRRRPWKYVRGGDKNRRITAYTPFALVGPAAGSDLLKTEADPTGRRAYGTFGNCSGGTTPWGTILSGEENFNGYFVANPDAYGAKRYGLTADAQRLRLGEGRPPLRRHRRRRTPTSPIASATSSRSTPATRPRPRASTRPWAGSSTRAPTSGSTPTARSRPTWVTTNASTTSTSSSRARSTGRATRPGPVGTT